MLGCLPLWLATFRRNFAPESSYNARFGREPTNTKDLHRKLSAADNLSEILAWREERTITHNLTLHYDRMMLILEPTPRARSLARKKVEVVNYPDGRFAVQSDGVSLPFRTFDKVQTIQPGTIVDNKRLSAVLTMVQARQAAYAPNRQRGHVARQRPPNNLEAPGVARRTLPRNAVIVTKSVARHLQCAGQGRRPQGLRCAHRLTPASALDPTTPAQREAMAPCGDEIVRRWRDRRLATTPSRSCAHISSKSW
jgi:hypothetical protein